MKAATTLRHRVRSLRIIRHWSVREVARRTDGAITNAHVSQIETGVTENPTLSTLLGLAKAFEVTVGYLIGEKE